MARRERHYRFDVERLTGLHGSPTIYNFGYLRPAHTQCYWTRRELQVRELLDSGSPAPIAALPTCMED